MDIIVAVLGILALVNHFYAQGRIKRLTGRIDLVEHQDISTFLATGNKSAKVNGLPMVPNPINNWNKDFVARQDGKVNAEFSSLAIEKCESVIQKLPSYLFGYYFLALCKKKEPKSRMEAECSESKIDTR